MKLEVDLVRQLLLHIEEHATRPISDLDSIKIDSWTRDQIDYHIVLLEEAGLIEADLENLSDHNDPDVLYVSYNVHRLTYKGHELLETIRDDSVWRVVKEKARTVGAVTLPVVAQIGGAYIKTKLGLP